MLEDFIARVTAGRSLHHFTDRSNAPTIKTMGLLSYAAAKRAGIMIPRPGGNDWSHDADANRGLDEYVHLSLTDNHPMLYHAKKDERIVDAIHLRIAASVLRVPGVLMTLDVSNKAGVPALPLADAMPHVDHDILFTRLDWRIREFGDRRRAADKYEILIPASIASNLITFPYGV